MRLPVGAHAPPPPHTLPEQDGYEDNRIFNNGLSDEAGAGAHVGLAAKVSGAPVASEVAKLDLYASTVRMAVLAAPCLATIS